MKTQINKLLFAIGLSIVAGACGKENIPTYDNTYNAIRFLDLDEIAKFFDREEIDRQDQTFNYYGNDSLFQTTYSFISDPMASSKEMFMPVIVTGKAADYDRKIAYRVIEEKTTAPTDSYEITGAVIPAGALYGFLRVNVKNAPELADQSYLLQIKLQASDEMMLGPEDLLKGQFSWNADLPPIPMNANYTASFNLLIQSPVASTSTTAAYYNISAHKVILAATGWDFWDDRTKAMKKYGTPGAIGYYATYKYPYMPRRNFLMQGDYNKVFAAKIADYIEAYNKEHPEAPLLHDAGIDPDKPNPLAGQPIEARKY